MLLRAAQSKHCRVLQANLAQHISDFKRQRQGQGLFAWAIFLFDQFAITDKKSVDIKRRIISRRIH